MSRVAVDEACWPWWRSPTRHPTCNSSVEASPRPRSTDDCFGRVPLTATEGIQGKGGGRKSAL